MSFVCPTCKVDCRPIGTNISGIGIEEFDQVTGWHCIGETFETLLKNAKPITGEHVGRAVGRFIGDEVGVVTGIGLTGALAGALGMKTEKDKKIEVTTHTFSWMLYLRCSVYKICRISALTGTRRCTSSSHSGYARSKSTAGSSLSTREASEEWLNGLNLFAPKG